MISPWAFPLNPFALLETCLNITAALIDNANGGRPNLTQRIQDRVDADERRQMGWDNGSEK